MLSELDVTAVRTMVFCTNDATASEQTYMVSTSEPRLREKTEGRRTKLQGEKERGSQSQSRPNITGISDSPNRKH